MARVTVKVEGADKLKKLLNHAQRMDLLEKPMGRAVKRVEREMKQYPAERSGSSYRRTHILEQGWHSDTDRIRNGVRGKIGTNVGYAPWVQSEQFQVGIHRGRWQTDQEVVDRNLSIIVRDFEYTIKKALR